MALIRVDKRGVQSLEFVGNHRDAKGVWQYHYRSGDREVICYRLNLGNYHGKLAEGYLRQDGKIVLAYVKDYDWDQKSSAGDVKMLSALLEHAEEEI